MWKFLLLILAFLNSTANSISVSEKEVQPSLETGAYVYKSRCVICHDSKGTGNGLIPLKIKDYPNTNLISPTKILSEKDLKTAIIYGGSTGAMSSFMPPMGNDLTWTEIESVVQFVSLLKSNTSLASTLIKKVPETSETSLKLGQKIFSSHCILCHGKFGEGDGRMSKVIKSPPPTNLTKSRLPNDYLKKIISGGGQSVGRSSQMPPWGEQFKEAEINSIILYLKSIRN